MSKGFVMLAQNSEYDYVQQASVCAMSILATNPNAKISLITNDTIPEKYIHLFDQIILIPWNETKDTHLNHSVSERWKIYHASPYDETIVLDTDMLVLQDISSWWKFLSNYKIYFPSNVLTYRGATTTGNYYRRAFTANNLPNLYVGLHYFKKCDFAHEFYKWIELVTNNWELFYGQFVQEHYPRYPSMDVTVAIVSKILDCDTEITNSLVKYPTFTHMKPYIQEWQRPSIKWQDKVGVYLSQDLKLTIGNHIQTGVFHYTEKDFISDDIVQRYENYLGVKSVIS